MRADRPLTGYITAPKTRGWKLSTKPFLRSRKPTSFPGSLLYTPWDVKRRDPGNEVARKQEFQGEICTSEGKYNIEIDIAIDIEIDRRRRGHGHGRRRRRRRRRRHGHKRRQRRRRRHRRRRRRKHRRRHRHRCGRGRGRGHRQRDRAQTTRIAPAEKTFYPNNMTDKFDVILNVPKPLSMWLTKLLKRSSNCGKTIIKGNRRGGCGYKSLVTISFKGITSRATG